MRNIRCPTILVDLRATEDSLWHGLHQAARKQIRQAQRENIVIDQRNYLTEEYWRSFLPAYRRLLLRKRNAGALGIGQISELSANGFLAASMSRDKAGSPLSWHTYVCAERHARLLNTISNLDPAQESTWNNFVGRAHKLHHWKDMIWLKERGFETYDFGGVYRGTEDREQLNIARFKSSFGGVAVDLFDAVLPLTFKGRMACAAMAYLSTEMRAGGAA